jgi:PAS domain S-box-containing protein
MPITSIISWVLLVVLLCLAIEIFRRRTGSRSLAGEPDKPPNTLLGRLEELENQEALLLSVLDSAPGGIMAFRSLRDEQGAVSDFELVLANKSASDMVGREPGDMPGKSLGELFPGALAGEVFNRCGRVVDAGEGEHFETFQTHGDLRRWLSISAEPWADGFVATFEEISQRKRVEQELQESIEELERFNRAMIVRENRVLEMKTEVNLLRSRLGLPPEYKVDSANDEL